MIITESQKFHSNCLNYRTARGTVFNPQSGCITVVGLSVLVNVPPLECLFTAVTYSTSNVGQSIIYVGKLVYMVM